MGNKDEKEVVDKKRRKISSSTTEVTIKNKEDIYTVSRILIWNYKIYSEPQVIRF